MKLLLNKHTWESLFSFATVYDVRSVSKPDNIPFFINTDLDIRK